MKEKQTILLIHNYYKVPGGEDVAVANEKRLLEQHGHEVLLYTRSNQEMESFSIWQKLLLPFTSLFSLRTYREVKRLIKKERPDIVHVHNTLTLISPSVYYAALACGVPVVQTMHNFRLLCPGAAFVRDGKICEDCVEHGLGCAVRHGCYRGSKLQTLMSAAILWLHRRLGTYRRLFYICLTEFNREKLLLLNRSGGSLSVRQERKQVGKRKGSPKESRSRKVIDEERIFVKTNFVWRPPEREVQKKDQYLFVGRLDILKGICFLLETWRKFPDRKLLICGSGPEEEWVRTFVKTNHMDQVEVLGQVPHEEVMRLAAESRALLMPALWYEGQGLVLLESYAVGTPVLASALGNPGDIIIPGVTGFRFAPGNGESLKEAVEKLEKKTVWDTRQVYEEQYSPEKNYEKLKEIYDCVVRSAYPEARA